MLQVIKLKDVLDDMYNANLVLLCYLQLYLCFLSKHTEQKNSD